MGSRAVVVVCRDEDVTRRRFGIVDEGFGICYTRTGRRFFDEPEQEAEFLTRVRGAAEASGLFENLGSGWLLLDGELMPWSAKAQELLRQQYASVGAAAGSAFLETLPVLEAAADGVAPVLARFRARAEDATRFVDAYRRYCWPVRSVDDLKFAPFHLLASEGAVHVDKDHLWHMTTLAEFADVDPGLLGATGHVVVGTTDAEGEARGTSWWQELTGAGGEGMVVKPLDFARGRRWPRPACAQVSRAGVPADHLRARVHGPRESRAPPRALAWPEALARRARVRPRHRGT